MPGHRTLVETQREVSRARSPFLCFPCKTRLQARARDAEAGARIRCPRDPWFIHRGCRVNLPLRLWHQKLRIPPPHLPSRFHFRCGDQRDILGHRGTIPLSTAIHDETKWNVHGHVLQYKWLSRDYEDVRKLQFAYILKAIIVAALFVFSVVFAVTIFTDSNVGGQSSKSTSYISHRLISFVCPQVCLNGSSPLDTPCTCSLSGMIFAYPKERKKEASPSRDSQPIGVGRVKPTKLSLLGFFMHDDVISFPYGPLRTGIDSLHNFDE